MKYHYTQGWSLNPEQLRRSLNDEDFVRGGVACYLFGVGDYGGNPTKAEIEFWMAEQDRVPHRIPKFSTCLEFFNKAEQLTGPFEIESFMYFQPGAAFCDSRGRPVIIQEIPTSVICRNRRWLFVDTLSAQSEKSNAFSDQLSEEGLSVIREGKMISTGNAGIEHPCLVTGKDGRKLFRSPIHFAVIPDASDTWGRGIRGFGPAQD